MTDAVQAGTEWVPRLGLLEVPREHAELIRGLFELAAFVADHPELPVPNVHGRFYLPWELRRQGWYGAERDLVDELAAALGVVPEDDRDSGHYSAERYMGPIRVVSVAITVQAMARYEATMSYSDNVQPEPSESVPADGAR
ncbi:hypothetical protein ACXC9Q_38750 (plasmid) [Kribbella sp. CWNU-51]